MFNYIYNVFKEYRKIRKIKNKHAWIKEHAVVIEKNDPLMFEIIEEMKEQLVLGRSVICCVNGKLVEITPDNVGTINIREIDNEIG